MPGGMPESPKSLAELLLEYVESGDYERALAIAKKLEG
jgi:hypothetical protein